MKTLFDTNSIEKTDIVQPLARSKSNTSNFIERREMHVDSLKSAQAG